MIGQRDRALEKKNAGLELDEYENYLIEAPYKKWLLIINYLSNATIEENIYDDFLENPTHYKIENNEIIFDENWEEIAKEKEKARIANLTITKREFALCLQKVGVTYAQLKELISTNEQAQLEWDLCVCLERKNPLLDVMAAQLGITSEMLDKIFKYANSEIDTLE